MIGAAAIAIVIAFLERGNIPVLIVDRDFLETMGILRNPAAQGFLTTGFVLTYGIFNIVLGPAVDRLGARLSLTATYFVASLVTVVGAASGTFALFVTSRFARGVFDAPQFPTMNRFVKNWFPPNERATANATWLTAAALASAVAIPLATALIANFGWRVSLIVTAAMGALIAAPIIWWFTTDKPSQSRFVGADEIELIEGNDKPETGAVAATDSFRSGAGTFLRNPDFWLMNLYHIATLSIYWGLLAWMPKYLVEARGFNLVDMSLITGASFGVAAVATMLSGMVSDRLPSRAPLCATMLMIVAGAILLAAQTPVPIVAGAALGVAVTARSIGSPNLFALLQQVIPANVISSGIGVDNGISNVVSALTPAAIGLLIGATGRYEAGLYFMVGLALVGTVVMVVLSLKRY